MELLEPANKALTAISFDITAYANSCVSNPSPSSLHRKRKAFALNLRTFGATWRLIRTQCSIQTPWARAQSLGF